ncbi:uncharacterized protein At1g51745-like isoform X2 [Abrus precatorius]|uniref:Uncharacterized protein At1g51745-like isoform X2 n=1 Tax=Abrus precatorius TaxID=3816 RepID=A0A8B8LFQ1_ABRPR|nr:uncharacterized protein At1g51745-like isoform X2 [Abrus precatorius]
MDCGVGSIVWVRRRNGSWWPGQILGPDDLSASHLTSPRSGTPVKLLGREDASVDWYNLEKSKRVKAFRCGEFDDCIERAESSQGMPLKKREKYARREDAILHALELERQMLKKQGKSGITSDQINCRSSNTVRKGIGTLPSEILGNDNEKHANSKSFMACENETTGGSFPLEVAKDGSQLSGEVDYSETIPRMRDLQDFGLKIAPLKRKLSSSFDPNISQKLAVDDGARALASGDLCMGTTLHMNGQVGGACRAKRSRCMYFPVESSDSLDYKETLAHVEMSSSQLRREFPYHGSLFGETESAFMDDVGSDSSETASTESDSDSSETEPDMDEEMTIFSETGRGAEEHESTSSEDPDELAISGDMPHLYPRDQITCNEAVSKWKLKGKRNNRNLVKRSVGASDRKCIMYGAEGDAEGRSYLNHKRMGPSFNCYKNDFNDALDDDDDEMFGLEDEYSLASRAISRSQNKIHRGVSWNDWAWDDHLASKGYWDIKGYSPKYGDRHHFGGKMRSMLVNVDLKVQASYRKEPVPIVSLMSKLDGRAIIGHPIQVEALKDGSSDVLFPAMDDFSNDGIGIEGSSVLTPAWSTARRTANFRVPRSHVSSSNGAEVAAEFPSSDQEQNFEYKKLNAGSSSHKASFQKKSALKSHRSSADKKSLKKMPKKLSLSSSQKTRTLSSLSTEHNLSRKTLLHDSGSYQTERLIKPAISGPPTVACIPVQLVFSRLLEKINRPPLKAANNAALLNTGVERNS